MEWCTGAIAIEAGFLKLPTNLGIDPDTDILFSTLAKRAINVEAVKKAATEYETASEELKKYIRFYQAARHRLQAAVATFTKPHEGSRGADAMAKCPKPAALPDDAGSGTTCVTDRYGLHALAASYDISALPSAGGPLSEEGGSANITGAPLTMQIARPPDSTRCGVLLFPSIPCIGHTRMTKSLDAIVCFVR